jgi:hypothetical protein
MAPGPAVRDPDRERGVPGLDGPASRGAGGDVRGTGEVAVPGEPAARARKNAAGGLGHPPGAGRAGGGGSALVDEDGGDPGAGGLVLQGPQQVAQPLVPDPLVMPPPRIQTQHPAGVADSQGPGPAGHRPADDLRGGLVLGLAHPPPVRGFGPALPGAGLLPPPRPRQPAPPGRITTGRTLPDTAARSGHSDAIDATVVCLAADGDDILTADLGDLRLLAEAAEIHVDLIPV